jgi:hypothetical protein
MKGLCDQSRARWKSYHRVTKVAYGAVTFVVVLIVVVLILPGKQLTAAEKRAKVAAVAAANRAKTERTQKAVTEARERKAVEEGQPKAEAAKNARELGEDEAKERKAEAAWQTKEGLVLAHSMEVSIRARGASRQAAHCIVETIESEDTPAEAEAFDRQLKSTGEASKSVTHVLEACITPPD